MDHGGLFVGMIKYGSKKEGGQTYAMLDLEAVLTNTVSPVGSGFQPFKG